MSEQEKILKNDLDALAKKFPASWHKVYYLKLSQTFSINLPAFSNDEIPMINEFCTKHNLWWAVMQAMGQGEKGVIIMFYNTKKQ